MSSITDDMIRAACNAHGNSSGSCEWEWMRDALAAAERAKGATSEGGTEIIVVLWERPPDDKYAGGRFWAAHSTTDDGRLRDWPNKPLCLIPRGAAKVVVTEGEGLDLLKDAAAP